MMNTPIVKLYNNEPKVPALTLNEEISSVLKSYKFENFQFRNQYQPQCIQSVLNSFTTETIEQYHIGCGGGKTAIFLLPLIFGYASGQLLKTMIQAPRLALITQHIEEIDTIISFGKINKTIPHDFILNVVEISSRTFSKKKKDEFDNNEFDDQTQFGDDKEPSLLYKNINYTKTHNDPKKVTHNLKSNSPVLFVGCINSVLNSFIHIVNATETKFDLLINDEYHNLITQNKKRNSSDSVEKLFSHFKSVLNFSATPRRGKGMSSSNADAVKYGAKAIFGKEVANVSTAHLKNMGYLKQNIKLVFVEAGATHSITDGEEVTLRKANVEPQQFYKEMAILKEVIRFTKEKNPDVAPHILTATSRINLITKIKQCSEFRKCLTELTKMKESLFNVVSGSTSEEERKIIFGALKAATSEDASLTMQHSVLSEGIDITNFNIAVLLRGMNEIVLNQFINRVTRCCDGYNTAWIFVQLNKNDSESYKKQIKEFFNKLTNYGLTIDDIEVEGIVVPGDAGENEKTAIMFGELDEMKKIKVNIEEVLGELENDALELEAQNIETPEELLEFSKKILSLM